MSAILSNCTCTYTCTCNLSAWISVFWWFDYSSCIIIGSVRPIRISCIALPCLSFIPRLLRLHVHFTVSEKHKSQSYPVLALQVRLTFMASVFTSLQPFLVHLYKFILQFFVQELGEMSKSHLVYSMVACLFISFIVIHDICIIHVLTSMATAYNTAHACA